MMTRTLRITLSFSVISSIACGKQDAVGANPSTPAGSAVATPAKEAVRPATLAKLTPNELRWGISPTRNDKVTYQDDVLVMEHGSDAIRAMAPNGLTWTIDAKAPHADQIAPDVILFATGRVVGRVLSVDHKGDELAVTLGPVAITDVIKDVALSSDQPLDLASMVVYTAPDYPGATTHDEPAQGASADWGTPVFLASYTPQAQAAVPVVIGAASEILIDNFRIVPVCCSGIGITITHDGQGAKMLATASLLLKQPSVHFDLVIRNGTVVTALVELRGATGFRVHLAAGTDAGVTGNIHQNFFVPVDASFPIGGLAVPLSVVFRQTLTLTTMFTAQTGTLEATGEYDFGGVLLKAGKQNGGAWGVQGPRSPEVKQSLANSLSGASLGVNALVFGYGAKVIVGIGAFGFVTGPYLGYNTVVALEKGSSMTMAGMPPCRSARLTTAVRYGVGYQMPQLVTNAINFFLHALNIRPILSEGGVQNSEDLMDKTDTYPAGCGSTPAS
ncbi:MAG: hypothetical protein M3Z05_06435 [Gemmatimonadota bacterium]|nr:hypothetical protein [Gemmatimonadota bacterium]